MNDVNLPNWPTELSFLAELRKKEWTLHAFGDESTPRAFAAVQRLMPLISVVMVAGPGDVMAYCGPGGRSIGWLALDHVFWAVRGPVAVVSAALNTRVPLEDLVTAERPLPQEWREPYRGHVFSLVDMPS